MIDNYLLYITSVKRYSPHTVKSYSKDISQFLEYVYEDLEWPKNEDIGHQQVRSWMVHLMKAGIESKSINRKLSSLRSYFNYLLRQDLIERNPMSKIIAQKVPKRLPQVLQEKELDKLLDDKMFDDSFPSSRDKIMLELFYQTGIRRSELINLKVLDVDFYTTLIKVTGKGNKERLVPFGPDLKNKLEHYLHIRDEAEFEQSSAYLCLTNKGLKMYPKFVYNIVKKYIGMVSTIDMKSPHVLRHSFATHLSNKGAELNAIKELLGHSNLAATQIYTHNSIEKLKEEYHKAHPKGNG